MSASPRKGSAGQAKNQSEGPGMVGVIIMALVALFIGVNSGILQLAIQPVVTARTMPSEEDRKPNTVYYIAGVETGSAGWEGLARTYFGDGPFRIRISEANVNTWLRSTFVSAPPSASAQQNKSFFRIIPSHPNARFGEGTVDWSVPVNATLSGRKADIIFQAQCDIRRVGGRPVLIVQDAYLGSARLPPFYRELVYGLFSGLLASHETMESGIAIWEQLSEAQAVPGQLTLERR